MPQFIILAIAGAGLYAGYKLLARQLTSAARATEDIKRRASASAPKDLGTLEFDAETNVYRPSSR